MNGDVGAHGHGPDDASGVSGAGTSDSNIFPGLVEFLLGPPTPVDGESSPRAASVRFGSAVRNVIDSMLEAGRQKAIELAAASPYGQQAQADYLKQQWTKIATSPVTWVVVGGVIVLLIFAPRRR